MPKRLSRIPANLPHLEVVSDPPLLGSLDLACCSLNGDTLHRASQSGEGNPSAPSPGRILTSSSARCCWSLKWRSDSGSGSHETKLNGRRQNLWQVTIVFLTCKGGEGGKEGPYTRHPMSDYTPCIHGY